jgi:ring-1,2-phenylacetyl-CoA epoxidase subunit PaaE
MTAVPATGQLTAHALRRAVFRELRVASIEPLTDDSMALTFEVPAELREEFEFVQGQHVSVRCLAAGDDLRRSYSICTAAGSGVLKVGVKVLPGGAFSTYAQQRMRVGETIDVLTPTGGFNVPLDPARRRHHVAIAAGSGITPILSIMATTLEREPLSAFTLVYGNRTSATIMFLEELEDLKNRFPTRLQLISVLSREPTATALFNGRIDSAKLEALLEGLIPPETVDEWFVCGPLGLVTTVKEVLPGRGVDAHHVHSELFHSEPVVRRDDAVATEAGSAEVTVVLDGRTTTLSMPLFGAPVLDAVLAVRSDAPFACRGGVCGTCRARLVEGTVRMDQHYALEDEEIESGVVLTCQSHPTSERVVLDYDL